MVTRHFAGVGAAQTACGLTAAYLPWAERTYLEESVLCADCQKEMRQNGRSNPNNPNLPAPNYTQSDSDDAGTSIAERVRFWQEQDKINQTLIPRVLRQHELLTGHIREHESLPEMVSKAVAMALQQALNQQEQQHQAALEAQDRQYEAKLAAALTAQEQQYDTKLAAAIAQATDALEKRSRKTRIALTSVAVIATAAGLGGLALNLLG